MRLLRLIFIVTAALSPLLASGRASAADAAGPVSKHPNILFVLIDDMGYRDLSCFGGTRVKTPEIDRMAAEGLAFDRFYVSSPICSPSRTALLTGQYPSRWHITSYLDTRKVNENRGLASWLSLDAPTVARPLQQAGYHTP